MIQWSFGDPAEIAAERARMRAFRELYAGLKRRIELLMTVAGKG